MDVRFSLPPNPHPTDLFRGSIVSMDIQFRVISSIVVLVGLI